jgi:15-cis-phytoene synthase
MQNIRFDARPLGATRHSSAMIIDPAVLAAARARQYDRYLAALFAPAGSRAGLMALAAFASELAHVSEVVTEPMMGEIRLQWWRDQLQAGPEATGGHPVADAIRAAITKHALPAGLLIGMIDAQASTLDPEPFQDLNALRAFLAKAEGAQFVLAARVLGAGHSSGLEAAAASAGQAYGLARLLQGLPRDLAQGWLPLPVAELALHGGTAAACRAGTLAPEAAALLTELAALSRAQYTKTRTLIAELPAKVAHAFAIVTLVPSYLAKVPRDSDGLQHVQPLNPLMRYLRIATAPVLGGFGWRLRTGQGA